MTISFQTADAIDAMLEQLRQSVKRLEKERDDLFCENARLKRQNLDLNDELYEAREALTRTMGAL